MVVLMVAMGPMLLMLLIYDTNVWDCPWFV